MMSKRAASGKPSERSRVVASGAGAAPDRIGPAIELVASGLVDGIALECLAERTLVPGLLARRNDPAAGADPRLKRRLRPLLGPARSNGCRIVSNIGAANPEAAMREVAKLARDQDWSSMRVAAVTGDDVVGQQENIRWQRNFNGNLLGAHAYLGGASIVEALAEGADVVITGRVADAVLYSSVAEDILDGSLDALAGALTVGHLLECTGHLTGGNFEAPVGVPLSAADYANLGYPMAKVAADGSAELSILEGASGRVDQLTCTLQLLYEVHDPSAYITPDLVVDFTNIQFDEVSKNRVRVSGARACGRPTDLKVSGFVEEPGVISDIEIGYGGSGALARARLCADALRIRLGDMLNSEDHLIDIVGVDSVLGGGSAPTPDAIAEARVHVSARCLDAEAALAVEDETLAMSLSGPAGGGSIRVEKRPNIYIVNGLIDRSLVKETLLWEGKP